MENKEIKNVAAELNDDALENVSGGLLVPLIPQGYDHLKTTLATCAKCRSATKVSNIVYQNNLINGVYYCGDCKSEMT